MVQAIIAAQFNHVDGYEEIRTDDYELFNTLDSNQIIDPARNDKLMPGVSMTMAIIVHESIIFDGYRDPVTCPRPGCRSKGFIMNELGDKTWHVSVRSALCSSQNFFVLTALLKLHLQGLFWPRSHRHDDQVVPTLASADQNHQ